MQQAQDQAMLSVDFNDLGFSSDQFAFEETEQLAASLRSLIPDAPVASSCNSNSSSICDACNGCEIKKILLKNFKPETRS